MSYSQQAECYVVFLPKFTYVMQPCTHRETYEDALKNAQEVLEMLIESSLADGETLPKPKTLGKQC